MDAGQIQIPVFSAEKSRFHRDKALQSAGKVGKLEFASLTCSTLNLQKGSLEVPTDTDMSGHAAVTTNDVVAGFEVKIGTGTEVNPAVHTTITGTTGDKTFTAGSNASNVNSSTFASNVPAGSTKNECPITMQTGTNEEIRAIYEADTAPKFTGLEDKVSKSVTASLSSTTISIKGTITLVTGDLDTEELESLVG